MHEYYDIAYKNLFEKQAIKTVVFFDKNLSEKNTIESESSYCKIFFYESKTDLLEKISLINKDDIYFINTFDEILIPLVHEIRIYLWIMVSKEYVAFRNKHIQREILAKYYPETTVKYYEIDIKNQKIENYYNKLDFPYIIKPSSWVQSAWVWIIENKTDLEDYIKNVEVLNKNMAAKWIENDIFLMEEFVDGEMYTIVYFVDYDWNISYSPIVKVNSAQKIWINDFFNYLRLSWTIIDHELQIDDVKMFIEKHVSAFGMRNTFMFHEFKKNSKWEFKNIELNARIWWYRLEMMQKIYNYNLLEMPMQNIMDMSSDYSNAVFVFYPYQRWILKWFNDELLNEFKNLDSYSSIRISSWSIWKIVWSTKDWFGSLVALRLKNDNITQFKNDYKFVERKYNELIILEQ